MSRLDRTGLDWSLLTIQHVCCSFGQSKSQQKALLATRCFKALTFRIINARLCSLVNNKALGYRIERTSTCRIGEAINHESRSCSKRRRAGKQEKSCLKRKSRGLDCLVLAGSRGRKRELLARTWCLAQGPPRDNQGNTIRRGRRDNTEKEARLRSVRACLRNRKFGPADSRLWFQLGKCW